EEDGLLRLLPDAQQLEVHLLPRERIERTERLVHENELRIVDECARNGSALLHAAGKLVGIKLLFALEADEGEEVAAAGGAWRHWQAKILGGQKHVVDHAPPFQ